MKTKNVVKIAIAVCVVAALIGVYFFTPLTDYLSVDKVVEMTTGVPETIPTALIFLAIFFIGGSLLIPIPLMAFALSLVFDVWMSVLLAIPGFFLASMSGYGIGRWVDTDVFGESIQKHIDKIKQKVEDKGAWAVLALRLAPTPPFTVTSIISGAIKINPWKYIIGSTLGIMPLGLSAIFFGRGAIEMMQDPSGIAASTLVAAVLLFILYKVIKNKKMSRQEA